MLALALLLAACGRPQSSWIGQNIHAVDGYWVDTETRCPSAVLNCDFMLEWGLGALPVPDAAQVVGMSFADIPNGFVDRSGRTVQARGGMFQPSIVVFDLADGRRRVVFLECVGEERTNSGALIARAKCLPNPFETLRVGREPAVYR